MIDLHTHSTASDGSLTPSQLVAEAENRSVQYLALTDHDTVSGLDEAVRASQDRAITVIPGIEVSARWQNRTLHIVGLGIDARHPTLQSLISAATTQRIDRAKLIGQKLEQAGIENAYDNTVCLTGTDVLGRTHFARMLIEQGHAKNFKKVFKRFMVQGKPGYVPSDWVEMEHAINIIQQSGGVAVLAHPTRYSLSNGQLEKVVSDFRDFGGNAIEVISGNSTASEIARACQLASRFDLCASTGSDYHGPDKPWMQLGYLPGLPADCKPIWSQANLW